MFLKINLLVFLNNPYLFIIPLAFLPPLLVTGPFLPDLTLSLLSIYFLLYSINSKLKNYFVFNIFYVYLIFSVSILFSSLFSDDIIHSLGSSLLYVRFLIFSIFIIFLMESYSKLLVPLLFLSLAFTFLIVSLDGIYEYFLGNNFFKTSFNATFEGRLGGLFADEWVIGSYLVRLYPLLCYLFILFISSVPNNAKKKVIIFFLILSLIVFLTIILSGERTALVLFIVSHTLLFLRYYVHYLSKFKYLIILLFIFLITSFSFNPKILERTFSDFNKHTSFSIDDNKYLAMTNTAFLMFLDKPFLGHGPKSFRIKCSDSKYTTGNNKFSCNTHPHSTYLQLLSETGIFGFSFIFGIFCFIAFSIFKRVILTFKNIKFLSINQIFDPLDFLLVAIFINYLPLIPSGSFFNNWLNIIYFLPISFLFFELRKKNRMNSINNSYL